MTINYKINEFDNVSVSLVLEFNSMLVEIIFYDLATLAITKKLTTTTTTLTFLLGLSPMISI